MHHVDLIGHSQMNAENVPKDFNSTLILNVSKELLQDLYTARITTNSLDNAKNVMLDSIL